MKFPILFPLLLMCLTAHAGLPDEVVPRPRETQLLKGNLRVSKTSVKCDPAMDRTSVEAVSRFAADLSLASGRTCTVSSPIGLRASVEDGSAKGLVFLLDKGLQPEEYSISVNGRSAVVRASSAEGFVYSLQTLRQLLPESIFGGDGEKDKWVLPCCEIRDSPQYGYRGLMLDCSRHFWSVDQIKLCLDWMEKFKLNRFHWHLTDDQGWRIEIEALPLLSNIASWREGTAVSGEPGSSDHIRYGGIYSKDDVREVISYAAARGITVVPEISLPGHALAALSAYPGIGCSGGPYSAAVDWNVDGEPICAGKQESYVFVQTVLDEVAALFPSEYIHIGASDCPLDEMESCPDCQAKIRELGISDRPGSSAEQQLLGYFVQRAAGILAADGKKAVCREAALDWLSVEQLKASGLTLMCSDLGKGRQAAGNGIPVIFTSLPSGSAVGGVLGIQEDIWTDRISTPRELEDRLEQALPALSEKQWQASADTEKSSNLESVN